MKQSPPRGLGWRGRARISRKEGSARERRNAARGTQHLDIKPPLSLDKDGRLGFTPLPRVAHVADPVTEGDHTLNNLIDALVSSGFMED